MVKILITRHGETKQNVDGIVQGKDHGEINEKHKGGYRFNFINDTSHLK